MSESEKSACSHAPSAADQKVTDFKGRCVKAQIGGQDLTADCMGILVQIDGRDYSSLGFSLTNDRKVIFVASNNPAMHPTASAELATQADMVTTSGTHDYRMAVVSCDRGRDVPSKRITCTGQAEGQAVFFDFLIERNK